MITAKEALHISERDALDALDHMSRLVSNAILERASQGRRHIQFGFYCVRLVPYLTAELQASGFRVAEHVLETDSWGPIVRVDVEWGPYEPEMTGHAIGNPDAGADPGRT